MATIDGPWKKSRLSIGVVVAAITIAAIVGGLFATRPGRTAGALAGDANCDGMTDAVDAAIILQYSAALITSVPCPQDADVNDDGAINSVDSALILQYVAGLVSSLGHVDVAAVSTGFGYTCALTLTGGVKCWGSNYGGALGNGTTVDSNAPVDVVGLMSGVAAVSAGGQHACALTAGGGVKCWGYDNHGEVGDGTTGDPACYCRVTPVDVVGLTSGVVGISAGEQYTCVLTSVGGVKCWGANGAGQLGDDQACGGFCTSPVEVSGLTSGAITISAGLEHACVVTKAGGVKCWGYNQYGGLGDGTTVNSSTPVDVSGLTNEVSAVTAGSASSCALTTSGGVKCWGDNALGTLGDGTDSDRTTPVNVSGLLSGVTQVATEGNETCALAAGGAVKCWGVNTSGQLGVGSSSGPETCARWDNAPCSTVPQDTSGLDTGVDQISVAVGHACAIVDTGIRCWGANNFGQLGNGVNSGPQVCAFAGLETPCSTTPVDVAGLAPSPQ